MSESPLTTIYPASSCSCQMSNLNCIFQPQLLKKHSISAARLHAPLCVSGPVWISSFGPRHRLLCRVGRRRSARGGRTDWVRLWTRTAGIRWVCRTKGTFHHITVTFILIQHSLGIKKRRLLHWLAWWRRCCSL